MADSMRGSVKGALETATDKAKGAANRVADRVEPIQNGIQDAARAVADTAVHVKDEVASAIGGGCAATKETLGSVGKDVGALIRKYPLAALAIGLGLGLLVGRSTGRA